MLTMGQKIKYLLNERNISQAELARRSKISPQQINYYANDDRVPGPANITKISKAFDVLPSLFLDDIESLSRLGVLLDFHYSGFKTGNDYLEKEDNDPVDLDKALSEEGMAMFDGKPLSKEYKKALLAMLRANKNDGE